MKTIPLRMPILAAARARLMQIRPDDYARTRNHLEGAVTRLSPYITHGLLSLPEVLQAARQRSTLPPDHKFIQELAWREFFHHVWQCRDEAIFSSLHEGPLPDEAYARQLPEDIRRARTGVPVIDQAVRELYATGYLHNHARMWLASYIVHLRKVHWRVGADWLYGHLLDGDLASNHLSWQWVAGTGSHKPYLFNAENVARFAPQAWHSSGTVVDTTYEALDALARTPQSVPPSPRVPSAASNPISEPPLLHEPPMSLPRAAPQDLEGAWLIHPWNLGEAPVEASGRPRVGVFVRSFHQRWAWSERRWRFVHDRMREMGLTVFECADQPPANSASTMDPHLRPWLQGVEHEPVPRFWGDPGRPCTSFSQFWRRVQPQAARR